MGSIRVFKGGSAKLHTPQMICQCLEAGTSGGGGTANRPCVSVSPKSINTPSKSMKNTLKDTRTMEIAQELIGQLFQTLTSWSVDFLAHHFLLQENGSLLMTQEGNCFLKSYGVLNPSNLVLLY